MKDYCLIKFILLLLIFENVSNLQTENSLEATINKSKVSIEDIIEYFSENQENNKNNQNKSTEIDLLEKKSSIMERGRGCESMNLCSGKGTCLNGSCTCDEGFDYFDCSLDILSK